MNRQFVGQMPARIAHLPRDKRGFPIPKFVKWFDGEPNFAVIDNDQLGRCVRHNFCWICGNTMGRHIAFIIGPMCGLNRNTAEPPSHRECAVFAALNCPFMARPLAKRDADAVPEGSSTPGIMLLRNPGVSMLWVTHSYKTHRDAKGGLLFEPGDPNEIVFYANGRLATRAEVDHSIETGLPALRDVARRFDGPGGERALEDQIAGFWKLVDAVLPREERA